MVRPRGTGKFVIGNDGSINAKTQSGRDEGNGVGEDPGSAMEGAALEVLSCFDGDIGLCTYLLS